jgi:predicted amidohydrolase
MPEMFAHRVIRIAAASCAVLGLAAFQVPPQTRPILLVNETGQTITHFYASTPGFNVWEEDILGSDVIPAGAKIRIHIDNGSGRCRYDLRARLADGAEPYRRDVDLCEITEYHFTADPPQSAPARP